MLVFMLEINKEYYKLQLCEKSGLCMPWMWPYNTFKVQSTKLFILIWLKGYKSLWKSSKVLLKIIKYYWTTHSWFTHPSVCSPVLFFFCFGNFRVRCRKTADTQKTRYHRTCIYNDEILKKKKISKFNGCYKTPIRRLYDVYTMRKKNLKSLEVH